MSNEHPNLAEDLLHDLDAGASTAAALRAMDVMPDSLRSQGARLCLYIACVLLAPDRMAHERGVVGLRRAVASLTVLRDFYAQGKMPPGRRIHPEVAAILAAISPPLAELTQATNRFLAIGQSVLDSADSGETPDRERFDTILDGAFADFLPTIARLLSLTQIEVTAVRARNAAVADQARSAAEEALRRIDRLTRIVRMISVNARVEAARAGDAGRSFNVIATEITDLAGQVEVASRDIASRIGAIVTSFRAI